MTTKFEYFCHFGLFFDIFQLFLTINIYFLFFQPFEEATAPSSMSTEFESLEPQSLSSRIHESPNREFSSEDEVTLSLDEKNCTLTRMTGRRQKLPTLMPDNSSLNLWNLLCKNIGKDLSKISMPGMIIFILPFKIFTKILTLSYFNFRALFLT